MTNSRVKLKFFKNKDSEDDIPVVPGLSMTPAQVAEMVERGIPITTKNLDSLYYDGDTNPSWEVPFDRQRGVDPIDLWNAEQDVRTKVKTAAINYAKGVKNAKKVIGDGH